MIRHGLLAVKFFALEDGFCTAYQAMRQAALADSSQ
jgi:hypothetical protein